MVRLREAWPVEHRASIVNDVKEVRQRPLVVDVYGRYDVEELREVERRAMLMPCSHEPCVIEGKEIKDLQEYWTAWVAWAAPKPK